MEKINIFEKKLNEIEKEVWNITANELPLIKRELGLLNDYSPSQIIAQLEQISLSINNLSVNVSDLSEEVSLLKNK